MIPVVHLVGPGGAGKTSVGISLAGRLGWHFVDLDQRFMACEGDITACIEAHGYAGYARRNVSTYLQTKSALAAPAVCALSSGFMTYPADVDTRYPALRSSIESDALTALPLPAFDLETCVDFIVKRQLSRPYLSGNRANEESRIRARFPRFMALQCTRFRSDAEPDHTASQIERFVRARRPIVSHATHHSSYFERNSQSWNPPDSK
ncbi:MULTISPECIES: shikimate kinase [unclassified Variovorax]|uniref:shikimate kinase n=1 Tax=unclassified Variovorax TaxID=663243 RepID=UPI003ED14642